MGNEVWMGIVAATLALGGSVYGYLEWQARIMRTRIFDVPGGLRFEGFDFSMEMQRATQQFTVHAKRGQLTRTPVGEGEPMVQKAPLDLTLPAVGLRIEVRRVPLKSPAPDGPQFTGYCTVVVRGPEAPAPAGALAQASREVLTIDKVPEPVALQFQQFAGRVRAWVDKVERRIDKEHKEALRQEQDAAQAAAQEAILAQVAVEKAPDGTLDEAGRKALADAQIAQWRKSAGFTGNSSEVLVDADGRVVWFIDLCEDGRITLHANKRTIHTTLQGASIAPLGGELDIGVRDDYWTEEEPELRFFRLFKGLSMDARRAWKEKIDMVRMSLEGRNR